MPRKSPIPPLPTEIPDGLAGTPLAREAEEAEFTEEPRVPEPAPVRALVTSAADHHLVVGMATLANMSETEFTAKLETMKRGQERMATIQKTLMDEGTDYGRVKGIDKPFLHQPGAEKLANFYGLAVRQEAERIVRHVGDDPAVPPFAYHVRTYVHLGDTNGPIITTAFGEANPYEDKYHYRFAKPACPVCGRTDSMIRRKTPPQLAGKMQCANFGDKQGCGNVFEPNDPRLGPSGKEPTPDVDLYGLAETILQMASKRSMVSAVRRATGTSGLFTMDPDSPSVLAQSDDSGGSDGAGPVVETATIGVPVAPGGKVDGVTQVQLDRLFALAKEKGIGGAKIADLLNRLFGLEVEPTGAAATAAAKALTGHQIGQLIWAIETGEVPAPSAASVERDDPVAYATHPDDIGAK